MKDAPGKSKLKAAGMLLIVYGALRVISQGLYIAILTSAEAGVAAIFVIAAAVSFAAAALQLVTGELGRRYCNDLSRAKLCFRMGAVCVAVQALSLILMLFTRSFKAIELIGMVLPVVLMMGADDNRKCPKDDTSV